MSVATKEDADRQLVEIMVAYQKGEMEGFEQLFQVLATSVRNYLASLSRDFDRAEDLLQETFLQVHRSRHTYSPPRPVRPWIFGIARYVYLMDRRSKARKSKYETTAKDDLPELPVESLAEGLPVTDDLLRTLEEVPEDRREAVLLHHVWGFSFREIGAMLGISERAAKLRSFRGIQALRTTMAGRETG
jgi:RNA polymerase sigma-70 factor (ECF subfamily)